MGESWDGQAQPRLKASELSKTVNKVGLRVHAEASGLFCLIRIQENFVSAKTEKVQSASQT